MKLGVCYYPEHWPEQRWPVDARMMREAGLEVVRMGEFAWGLMEPAEGQFDWDWLDRAIQILASEGLKVVLGTPTATPPAWLVRNYPEVLPVDKEGRVRQFGSRCHYCHTSLVYREHTGRIVKALAQHFGDNRVVIGWQIDNEFGNHETARCYCERCASAFRLWLQKRYHNLDELNRAWGTVFWSQIYSDWEQILPPNLVVTDPNPSHVLDYYRFSSDMVVSYQQLQIDLLRNHTEDQFITHNLMGNFADLDYHDLARSLDFVSWDSYPTGYSEQHAQDLYAPGEARPELDYDLGDPYVTGFCHDLTRGLKGASYWVMEQQPGNINWGAINPGVRPGAVRLWTWHALASGADGVVYFRWRATRFAQEQYHAGLLRHDAQPNLGYLEVKGLIEERARMEQFTNSPYQAKVALLLDYKDLWAIQLQPHRQDFSYMRHLFLYYRALARLGIMTDILSPQADLTGYKLVIAPTLHMPCESLVEKLTAYVEAGGTLMLGVRSGFKTETDLVTDLTLPGLLRPLVGATVQVWHSLPPGKGYRFESIIPGLAGEAYTWAEALEPDEAPGDGASPARSLANYTEHPYDRWQAITEFEKGQGRTVYVGWYLTLEQARALVLHLTTRLGIEHHPDLPEGIISIRRGPQQALLNFTHTSLNVRVGKRSVTISPRNLTLVTPE
jgi:beta-galactosidase